VFCRLNLIWMENLGSQANITFEVGLLELCLWRSGRSLTFICYSRCLSLCLCICSHILMLAGPFPPPLPPPPPPLPQSHHLSPSFSGIVLSLFNLRLFYLKPLPHLTVQMGMGCLACSSKNTISGPEQGETQTKRKKYSSAHFPSFFLSFLFLFWSWNFI